MRIHRLVVLAATLFASVLSGVAFAAAFTPGNLVVYRVGDGSAALNANATAVFLDEITPAGALVQSIALPTADSGANQILTASGSSTTEGQMTRSADGTYLVLTGYDAPTGTIGVATSTSATFARVVGRVDSSGSIDTSTALANGFSGGNPRGVASADGSGFWLTGSNTGVLYAVFGATSATTVSSTATNLRAAGVFGGQVYISSGAGTIRMGAVGTGMPTTTGQATTALPGIPTAAPVTFNEFAFADLNGAVAGVDTLYVCDEGAGGGVQKYSLVTGTWTSNGVATGTCRGLTISVTGTTVTVYTTNITANNNALQTFTDTGGYNAPISGSLTTIASAGTNKAFRGVAFAPIAATPDLTLSVSGPANAIAGTNYDYTLTATNTGIAATGVAVNFTLPSGVTYVGSSGGGFSSSETAGVVSFTGGSIAGNSNAVLTVTVNPTSPGLVNVPAGSGVADPGNTIVESNEGNNATTQIVDTTVASPDPDLTASISGASSAVVGTNYDYTITVANGGPIAASAVRVDFALPSGVAYAGSAVAGGFSATLNGSTVEFTGGTVANGSPVVLTVTVTAPGAPTTVTVSPGAAVADPTNTIVETNEANNSSTQTVNTNILAASQPDLTVAISGAPTGTTYANYDYSITVANSGTIAASPTRVDFALPPGVTYVTAATSGGFSATLAGSTVQFTGGSVAGSGNVVLTVTVRAPGSPTTVNVAAGAVVADPFNAVTESDEGNNASTTTVATVVSDPANLVKIHDIQGTGSTSPVAGQVKTVDAIVTGYFPGLSGFFIQEEDADADADPLTSEGIFVFNGTAVNPGDLVRVQGTVQEFVSTGVTITELVSATVTVISNGNPLPSAVTVSLPVANSTFLERYEGMRVTFTQQLTVTDTFDVGHFGEVTLSANGRLIQPTNVIDPNDNPASGTSSSGTSNVAAVLAAQDLNTRSSIIIEDGSTASFAGTIAFWDNTQNTLRLGSTLDNLTGVMHQSFGTYRVLPQGTMNWTFAQRPLTPPPVGASNLKVGGMNTLNYFNGDGLGGGFPTSRGADSLLEFNRQRAKTIQAIHQLGADIVGLMEMESDGGGPNSAIQDLVNGLNGVAGAGTWAFINDPVGYTGLPGGTDLIHPAIIYKPAMVTPIGASMASGDSAFSNARAPIAQTFQVIATGQKLTVVANHFKSKGSGGSGLDLDQNDGQGFFNNARKNQATALLNFVNTTVIPAAGDPKVILLGDFNAYEQEDPMDILRAGGYTALASGVTSYSFDAQSGALDHALVSAALLPRVTGADKWHINADEPTVIDYNVENKNTAGCSSACTQPDYYTPGPFRVSDHDPVLVGLALTTVPTAPQNLQGTAGNAQIVLTYLAPTSDGGSAITGYNASCTDGGSNTGSGSSVGAALTITVGSLVNGVTYSCTVAASNLNGASAASTAATGLTPSTVPGAPTNLQGTAGNTQVVLTYLAPASDGGSPLTKYGAECTDGGSNNGGGFSVGTALTITVPSLVNGVTYTCGVAAFNANGFGTPVTINNLTPSAVPDAPTNVQATSGDAQATITYLAPANNGGSPITGYTATCTGGSGATGNSVGTALTIALTGLTNGVTYSCTVVANNASGPSVPSAAVQVSPQQPSFTVTVSKAGVGTGVITSSPAGINCGSTCVGTFANGATVTLTAVADSGSTFAGWTGCDSEVANQCTVAVTSDRAATASFVAGTYDLTVTKAGTGTGAVVSTSPASPTIGCGATCSATYASGTVVTLSAVASIGSTFTGWSGACTGTATCNVTMDAAKTVTATFDSPPRLGNISTRMQVLTGNDIMIGGFVIGGSATKRVAIVATGPSLTQYGITNALAHPTITLVRSSDQAVISTNDGWQNAANASQLSAAGFAPSNNLESAILVDLAPGAYTALVQGASNGTGVAVVAVYEVDHVETPLINISTRGRVLTGNDVMIGGFVIQGSGSQQVAIVATGPSLAAFGITNPLANPTVTLVRSSDQAVLATNDDWQTAANASTLQSLGYAPSDAREAAILITLPPGAYTAIVSGVGNTTGTGIVGVYKIN